MSMLTKKSKYGIKALIFLGKNYGKEPVQIMKIATEDQIPKKYLEQILIELRNAGLLYSIKGAKGGYSLNKDPKDIRMTQDIRLFDDMIALLPCVNMNYYRKCDECISEEICGIRDTFAEVRDAMLQILNDTSIADMIERENSRIQNI